MEVKDYKGAINDLNKAVNLDPKYARTYTLRGEVKFLNGDVAGACDDIAKAQKLGYMVAIASFADYCDD